ncbi:MAG: NnrU family protein [Pseudomonadota bacterium]
MALLIAGLSLFFLVHLARPLGLAVPLRARFGDGAYKGAHTLISAAGLVLMVLGYKNAEGDLLYVPLEGAQGLAHSVMPLAFILLAGAHMRSNLKRYVRHPMMLAVLLWAATHLAANGELESVLLFGAFGLYALAQLAALAPAVAAPAEVPRQRDLILVIAGLAAYVVALKLHGLLGPSVIG